MKKKSSDPSEEDELIEVDVEDNQEIIQTEQVEIDPIEEEKIRIEAEIIKLIDKGKINLLVDKYQNLSELLAEQSKLKEEYLNTAQLVQAEFENYKKQAHKDQEFSNYRNKTSIIQKFLTIYEDIERTHLQTTKDSDLRTVTEALKLVFRNIKESFSDLGVKVIDPQDEVFDPKYHEVLYTTENEKLADNKIIEVVSKGFILENIVLKPARVVISKVPKKKENGDNNN
ncbi:MAG: nucleotide exchange factor GrpE [Candidatus Heimdallarchaeaceae archaeon]